MSDPSAQIGTFDGAAFEGCKVSVHVTHIAQNYGPIYQAPYQEEADLEEMEDHDEDEDIDDPDFIVEDDEEEEGEEEDEDDDE